MIRAMAISFCRVTGVQPTREQLESVELEIRQNYGGERVYVASHPKAQMQARFRKLASKNQSRAALELGVSERGLRKALRGK